MKKLLYFPVALIFSCLLGGLYGALHNQISFAVSLEYFTEVKFLQFEVPSILYNSLGASYVGFLASWWMGLIIGVPLYLLALFIPGLEKAIRSYLIAACLVVGVTLATGLMALAVGYVIYSPDHMPSLVEQAGFGNPVGFARAMNMHNFSYMGGILGLICAVIYLIIVNVRVRKPSDSA